MQSEQKIMLFILILSTIIVFESVWAGVATNYVNDPTDCPATDATNFPGLDCGSEDICGEWDDNKGNCYDTSLISPPSPTQVNNNDYGINPGFGIDCYLDVPDTETYCHDTIYCQHNSTLWSNNRKTNCTDWGESNMGDCRSSYLDCTGDYACECNDGVSSCNTCGIGSSGNNNYAVDCSTCACDSGYGDCDEGGEENTNGCEVQFGVTNYPTGTNNHYDDCSTCGCDQTPTTYEACNGDTCAGDGCNYQVNEACATNALNLSGCAGCTCNSGYYDCDGDLATLGLGGTGCEIQDGDACAVGGASGSYSGCSCIVAKKPIITGNLSEYYTTANESYIWIYDWGLGHRMNLNGTNNNSFIVQNDGNVAIEALGECTQCLETYANGTIYCGTDETGGGSEGAYTSENFSVDYTARNPFSNINFTTRYGLMGFYTSTNFSTDYAARNPFSNINFTTRYGLAGYYTTTNFTADYNTKGAYTKSNFSAQYTLNQTLNTTADVTFNTLFIKSNISSEEEDSYIILNSTGVFICGGC